MEGYPHRAGQEQATAQGYHSERYLIRTFEMSGFNPASSYQRKANQPKRHEFSNVGDQAEVRFKSREGVIRASLG